MSCLEKNVRGFGVGAGFSGVDSHSPGFTPKSEDDCVFRAGGSGHMMGFAFESRGYFLSKNGVSHIV